MTRWRWLWFDLGVLLSLFWTAFLLWAGFKMVLFLVVR